MAEAHWQIRSERRRRGRRRRLRRRRRHARQRAGAEGRQGRHPRGRRARRDGGLSSTTSGGASRSSPGSTSAPRRAPGASPRTSPNLPAWIVKAVGGSTIHWAGASLRFQEHEFKAKTHLWRHRRRQPARLADHAGRDGALVRQGRGQDGRHPHQRHSGPARQQQLQGAGGRRQEARLQGSPHRQHGDQQRSRATTAAPASRSASASRAASRAPNGRRSITEIPKGEATGNLEVRPQPQVLQDRARRSRQGDRRRLCRQGRQAAACRRRASWRVAGNSIESPRLLLNSASTKFPDGLANSSGQVGRNYMRHMTGSVYAVVRQAGAHVSRHHHGRHHPRRSRATTRSAALSAATRWRRCRSACRSWRRSSIPAPGAAPSPARWRPTTTWPACGWSARTCRRRTNARHAAREGEGPVRPAGPQRALRRPSQRHRHARPRLQAGLRRSTRRSAPPMIYRRRPTHRRTISAPTG